MFLPARFQSRLLQIAVLCVQRSRTAPSHLRFHFLSGVEVPRTRGAATLLSKYVGLSHVRARKWSLLLDWVSSEAPQYADATIILIARLGPYTLNKERAVSTESVLFAKTSIGAERVSVSSKSVSRSWIFIRLLVYVEWVFLSIQSESLPVLINTYSIWNERFK